MSPSEIHFRAYEEDLLKIVRNYPSPSTVQTLSAASTIRQHLRKALLTYITQTSITSTIDRNTAGLLCSQFVFSETPEAHVYIGPRRTTTKQKHLAVSSPEALALDSTPSIPPVNVSDPTIRNALLTLKNFDIIPFPVNITHLTPEAETQLLSLFPNIELLPGPQPGCYTLL